MPLGDTLAAIGTWLASSGAADAGAAAAADAGAGAAAGIGAGVTDLGIIPVTAAAETAGTGLTLGDIGAGIGALGSGLGSALGGVASALSPVGTAAAAEAPTGVALPNNASPTSASSPAGAPSAPASPLAGTPASGTGGASGATAGSGSPAVAQNLATNPTDLTTNLQGGGALSGQQVQSSLGLTNIGPTADPTLSSATGGAPGGASASTPGFATKLLTSLGVGPQTAGDIVGGANTAGSILGPALAGYGLINTLTQPKAKNEIPGDVSALQSEAGQLATQGQSLQTYLQNGTLPPGAQAAVNQATNAAKAAIRQQYANAGITGSTQLTEALNQVDQQAEAAVFNMGTSLLQQGVSESQMAATLYNEIIGINNQQNAQTGSAIANFAAALNGATGANRPAA